MGQLPPPNNLQHVAKIQKDPLSNSQCHTYKELTGVQIGAGLPPVPQKLVQKIQSGEYVNISELLPEQLGLSDIKLSSEKQQGPKKKAISNILEWVQYFAIYVSVIAIKEPQRTPDLLCYMNFIIEAHREYSGDAWQGYNRRFRQRAAMTTKLEWDVIDTTLWNLAFTGHAYAGRCKHCFSLSHSHDSCDWAPQLATSTLQPPQPCYLNFGKIPLNVTMYALHGTTLQSRIVYFLDANSSTSVILVLTYLMQPILGHKAIHCRCRHDPKYYQTGRQPFPL